MKIRDILKFYDNYQSFVLGTMGLDGAIQMRAVTNVRSAEIYPELTNYFKTNNRIFITTNAMSDKMAEIRKNPAASLYVYDTAYNRMLLTGKIEIITDTAILDAIWLDKMLSHYPGGRHGAEFTLLEFIPKKFKKPGPNGTMENGDIK